MLVLASAAHARHSVGTVCSAESSWPDCPPTPRLVCRRQRSHFHSFTTAITTTTTATITTTTSSITTTTTATSAATTLVICSVLCECMRVCNSLSRTHKHTEWVHILQQSQVGQRIPSHTLEHLPRHQAFPVNREQSSIQSIY